MRVKLTKVEFKEIIIKYVEGQFKTIGNECFCDVVFVSKDGDMITDIENLEVVMDDKENVEHE